MKNFTKIGAILIIVAMVFGCASSKSSKESSGGSDQLPSGTPSGSIHWEGHEFSAILDGGWGHGTFDFNGKVYKFKSTAVGVGGFGGQKISATGKIYNMKDIDDFPGKYSLARAGATAAKGAGYWYIRNDKGVEIVMKPESEGLALSIGLSGITVKMVDEK